MNISRRSLLQSTTALGLVTIAACSPADTATIQKIATEANAIADGFAKAIGAMGASITATVQTQLQTYLADIQTAATAISSAASVAASQTPVGQIMTYVSGFASLIPGLGLPIAVEQVVSEIVTAAEVLVPIMAGVVGLAGASTVPPKMSEAQAIMILTAR